MTGSSNSDFTGWRTWIKWVVMDTSSRSGDTQASQEDWLRQYARGHSWQLCTTGSSITWHLPTTSRPMRVQSTEPSSSTRTPSLLRWTCQMMSSLFSKSMLSTGPPNSTTSNGQACSSYSSSISSGCMSYSYSSRLPIQAETSEWWITSILRMCWTR